MSLFKQVARGAATQFGREFGRAGANAILKGANHYTVRTDDTRFEGRVKPSDSTLVRAYKEIDKVSFVSTDKANVTRLIEMTEKVLGTLVFQGRESINETADLQKILTLYERKFDHGKILISDDFDDKSVDFLMERRKELDERFIQFNQQMIEFVATSFEIENAKKKHKKIALALSFPIWGILGFHHAYLGKPGYTVMSIVLSWTVIVPLINIFQFFKILLTSIDKFDAEHNSDYLFYKIIQQQMNVKG
jgi:TM2 domain-containing membrane protein YozV